MPRDSSDSRIWLDKMGAKGWTAPTWPKEYGGGGLSNAEAAILNDEMRKLPARPPLVSFGISMLGPVLLEYGNEAQKKRFLPEIVRGDIRWCQGYSEPGSGSDLASLQTRAVRDGDHFVVTGQKIWTSYADYSDWIFCLVRTDPKAPKHMGISFLLFDMDQPGIKASPIPLISGSSPFCQVFIQDVRVPADQLVGPLNGGWNIAKRLLEHERSMLSTAFGGGRGGRRATLAQQAGHFIGYRGKEIAEPLLREQIAQHDMDRMSFDATLRRTREAAQAGKGPGPAASMFKYYGTELARRRSEIMMSAAGANGLGWEGPGFEQEEIDLTRDWLRSKGNSIEGGTHEIQLNVIAKRVLGLPD
jgi:alkylation response protein AidB-like acyl-CoA dehydrogenase